MDLTNLDTIRNLLSSAKTAPRKEFGQNFLINREILEELVKSAQITRDENILEVGPGIGTVTIELAKQGTQLYTFELDKEKIPILKQTLKRFENIEVINEDFLQTNLPEFLQKRNIINYKFVSSLPYNIAKKILQIILETETKPDLISVIIQKEVAEKYVPKKNKETFLSNYLKLFAKGEIIKTFGPENFFPAPKVESALLRIIVDKSAEPDKRLIKFIKIGFLNPRKKLINTLSTNFKKPSSEVRLMFEKESIPENARAENLNLNDWKSLFEQLQPINSIV